MAIIIKAIKLTLSMRIAKYMMVNFGSSFIVTEVLVKIIDDYETVHAGQ
jgi:hypothetical protein